MTPPKPQLTQLSPIAQLRAGRLPRRLTQLVFGLLIYGVSMALMILASLGAMSWDVFHLGLTQHLPISFGTAVIVSSMAVLLLWILLRQAPGLGTVLNVYIFAVHSPGQYQADICRTDGVQPVHSRVDGVSRCTRKWHCGSRLPMASYH